MARFYGAASDTVQADLTGEPPDDGGPNVPQVVGLEATWREQYHDVRAAWSGLPGVSGYELRFRVVEIDAQYSAWQDVGNNTSTNLAIGAAGPLHGGFIYQIQVRAYIDEA